MDRIPTVRSIMKTIRDLERDTGMTDEEATESVVEDLVFHLKDLRRANMEWRKAYAKLEAKARKAGIVD